MEMQMETPVTSNKKFCGNSMHEKWRWILIVIVPVLVLTAFLVLLSIFLQENHEVVLEQEANFSKAYRFIDPPSESSSTLQCVVGVAKKKCSLHCMGEITGPELNAVFAAQDLECNGTFQLSLESCTFAAQTAMPHHFSGSYSLTDLAIINCDLNYIARDTFKQSPFAEMASLVFQNNNLHGLTEETFLGLRRLRILKIEKNRRVFEGENLLRPLADTIEIFRMEPSTISDQIDPKLWFGNIEILKLIQVELNGNNFTEILDTQTFRQLKSIEILSLQNCAITHLESGTFAFIAKTLKFLDLRKNNLKHLNVDFLSEIPVHQFQLELAENPWDCDCSNYDLIVLVQNVLIKYTEIPKCTSPDEWYNEYMSCPCITCIKDHTTEEAHDKTINQINGIEEMTTTFIDTNLELREPLLSTETTSETSSTENWPTTATTPCPPNETTAVTSTNSERPTTATISWPPNETTIKTSTAPEPPTTATWPPPVTPEIWTTTTVLPPTATAPTESPDDLIILNCSGYARLPFHGSSVYFVIDDLASTKVNIVIENNPHDMILLHFNKNSSNHYLCKSNCLIDSLIPFELYTFCLISKAEIYISAFQCRSHRMHIEDGDELSTENNSDTLFWSLFVLGIVLCFLIGSVAIYFMLRWRPVWLHGNKRLIRASPTSQSVFLYRKHPKPAESIEFEIKNESCERLGPQLNSDETTSCHQKNRLPSLYEIME